MPVKRSVLIVDDHPVFRLGLATLIDTQSDLVVSGQLATVPDAIAAIAQKAPEVIVLDLSLEGASGLELLQRLRDVDRDIPVLVVSLHDEHIYASRALRAGARGYVMKREPPEHVVQQIRRVLDGDIAVSAFVASQILAETVRHGAPVQDPIATLTNREFEVFQLIGRAVSTSKIAQQLCLSVKTVEAHRTNIKRKLNLDSAPELARRAVTWVNEQDDQQNANASLGSPAPR